ncbi:hypothetical protein [uncultured Sphingomonas sp.]|nr:hypothetical protein [uncultured Sphingomonas sp.]
MTLVLASLALVYGTSVTLLGGTALLSLYSPRIRESLVGASKPAL